MYLEPTYGYSDQLSNSRCRHMWYAEVFVGLYGRDGGKLPAHIHSSEVQIHHIMLRFALRGTGGIANGFV
jgi:hypothetical protein